MTDIRLTRARTRWGSCSATGVIRVNVALAAAPPDLLEYLVAHEVAHLRWRGHGPRFYATLARLLPDFQERRTRLRAFKKPLRCKTHLLIAYGGILCRPVDPLNKFEEVGIYLP